MKKIIFLVLALVAVAAQHAYSDGKISVADASGTPAANTLYSQGIIKGWIRYNGPSQTILGSYNVASVTYNSTGNYTINWDTDFADANYAPVCMSSYDTQIGLYAIAAGSTTVALTGASSHTAVNDSAFCIVVGTQ